MRKKIKIWATFTCSKQKIHICMLQQTLHNCAPQQTLAKICQRLSPKNLARHSPFSLASLALYTEVYNSISVLYKARENCIYTCKNVYLRVIHLIIQFTNILLQILQRKSSANYIIANYTIAVKYNFLQLYTTEVYILYFCFCIKREKHISSCYTLIIMQYTYILIRFNCMQNK